MDAQYSITIDASLRLVRITMSGFFAEDDIDRFVAERDAAHRAIGGRAGHHLTLVDIRGMKIQSQASVEAFTAVLGDPAARSRRIAFVVGAGLARTQLGRASAGRGRQFLSIEEAERWLLEVDGKSNAA